MSVRTETRFIDRPRLFTDWLWLGAIAALALGTRWIFAIRHPVIFNDGPRFISMAESMLRGEWSVALHQDFHPLMSGLMAWITRVAGIDLEAAGIGISIASGAVAAAALFILARDLYGRASGVAAGLLFAVHPRLVEVGAAVQSDGLHLALVLIAASCGWRALSSRHWRPSLWAGAACGFAYLTRPEGLIVAVVLGVWLGIDRVRGMRGWRQTLQLATGFGVALALVAGPYLVALRVESGDWRLSPKKEISRILTAAPVAEPSAALPHPNGPAKPAGPTRLNRVASGLTEVFHDGLRALHPVYLVLALIGIVGMRLRRRELYLLSFAAALLPILIGLEFSYGYVSRRHWLTAAALVLPLAARGLDRIARRLRRAPSVARVAPRLFPGLVVLLTSLQLVQDVSVHDPDLKISRREAALWLGEHSPGSVLAAQRSRLAYYASAGRFVSLPESGSREQLLRQLADEGAEFLIIEASRLGATATPQVAGPDLIYRVPYPGGSILVLRLHASRDADTAGRSAGGH